MRVNRSDCYAWILKQRENELYCYYTNILYTNPNDAPEDEVALVCVPSGTGIMMEWARPISKLSPFLRFQVHLRRTPLGSHPILIYLSH